MCDMFYMRITKGKFGESVVETRTFTYYVWPSGVLYWYHRS